MRFLRQAEEQKGSTLFSIHSFKAGGIFLFDLVFSVLFGHIWRPGRFTDYLSLCVYGFLFSWLQVLGNICFDDGRRVSHVLFLLFLFIFKILSFKSTYKVLCNLYLCLHK